jgi:hypothetical protein
MRLAASRAVIVESSRGWRLDKLKQQHKIDVVVALSMACLAAVRGQAEPAYDLWAAFPDEETDPVVARLFGREPSRAEQAHAEPHHEANKEARDQAYRNELAARIFQLSGGQYWPR